MIVNSQRVRNKRLKDKNIVIIDKFKMKYKQYEDIKYRSSDGKYNDKIYNGIRVEKEYIVGDKSLYCERDFDKDTKYTFISVGKDETIHCPNCGFTGTSSLFKDGCCSYCGTSFSVNYVAEKGKQFNPKDINLTLYNILVKWVPITLSLFTGVNTFFEKELEEIVLFWKFIFSIVAALGSFFIFMIISMLLLNMMFFPIWICQLFSYSKKYIWDNLRRKGYDINTNGFYNAVTNELTKYYFDDKNTNFNDLVDYDIVEYKNLNVDMIDGQLFIDVEMKVRNVFYINDKFRKSNNQVELRMKYNGKIEHKKDVSTIICSNCGKSVSPFSKTCEYCGREVGIPTEWTLVEIYKI